MRHAVLACLIASAAAFGSEEPPSRKPILKVTEAGYRLDHNVLEFGFLFINSSEGAVYVDCEGQPAATLTGKALALNFAAADSLAADTVRPQRVGAGQIYRGSRRIFGLGPDALGAAFPNGRADPAKAALLLVRMMVYPERLEGEGSAWVMESAAPVAAGPVPLKRTGKRPPPQKPVKIINPKE
jgi:hypothetical protein